MKKMFFVVSLLIIFASLVHSSGNVTLQTFINTAKQNNPEIKSSQKTYQSTEYSIVRYKNNY